jgi:hypothetical protein
MWKKVAFSRESPNNEENTFPENKERKPNEKVF